MYVAVEKGSSYSENQGTMILFVEKRWILAQHIFLLGFLRPHYIAVRLVGYGRILFYVFLVMGVAPSAAVLI
mgnify:FL=1